MCDYEITNLIFFAMLRRKFNFERTYSLTSYKLVPTWQPEHPIVCCYLKLNHHSVAARILHSIAPEPQNTIIVPYWNAKYLGDLT